MHALLLSLPLLSLLPQTQAWGDLGHQTIAYLASSFLHPTTTTFCQTLLNDTSPSYLANIATWADSYKYTTAGSFSAPFHYIDAEDSPPQTCNVDFSRDCAGSEGCSVSAIANYTSRLRNLDGDVAEEERNYALRFVVHLMGDITQPLHDEAFAVGGNEVDVVFDGEETNLHAVWDSGMPEMLRGGYGLSDAEAWAWNLTGEIQRGIYAGEAEGWLEGLDIGDAVGSAMVWARDANALVCKVVMPGNASVLETGDLYPGYYEGAIDTVELQIAKAGYRLAAWLDAIVEDVLGGNGTETRFVMRRPTKVDLRDERSLRPEKRVEKSRARMNREAFGYGCRHKH